MKNNIFNTLFLKINNTFNINVRFLINRISLIILSILLVSIMVLSLRGTYGNPTSKELLTSKWRNDGVFEVSPERGRFGLLYSFIEDKSFFFSADIGRFIVPDLGYKNGNYVSLFAPGVSFIVAPGYILGKYLGASQVGAFSIIALFALINTLLIRIISIKLGASNLNGIIAGFIFLFATPAYAYSVNLYQHHISTFLILYAVYLLISFNTFWSMAGIWFFSAMSIPVDYPNLFLMFPVGLAAIKNLFAIKKIRSKLKVKVKLVYFLSLISILIPLSFFLWFNNSSYGDPLQFSGTVGSVREIDASGKPTTPKKVTPENIDYFLDPDKQEKVATSFFKSRNMLNGLYLHILSPDRGILYFAPVLLFGISGAIVLYRKRNKYLPLLLSIAGINLFLYSMWGDPWGGWSFGSRYLVPMYAVISVLIAFSLTKVKNNWIHFVLFIILATYSVWVNTLGAITTSANPPKVETYQLSQLSNKIERYSFDRNWEYLNTTGSKSFAYNTFLYKSLKPQQFYFILAGTLTFLLLNLILALKLTKNEKN